MKQIEITTDRLHIRILEMKDKNSFVQYRSLPEVAQFQSWKPENLEDIEKFIDNNIQVSPNTTGEWLQLAVCLLDNEQMIGDIGVHFADDHQIEIGYTLSPEQQGKGYAAEAVKGLVDYIFGTWKKHRISASVDPENQASIKLLEKLGFRKEAHFIKSYYMNDTWCDDCIYAMLNEEWI